MRRQAEDTERAEPEPWRARLDPEARVAVLAVCLMLKNRNDAADVSEGSHVEAVLAEYERIGRLRAQLGSVSVGEAEQATALWGQLSE